MSSSTVTNTSGTILPQKHIFENIPVFSSSTNADIDTAVDIIREDVVMLPPPSVYQDKKDPIINSCPSNVVSSSGMCFMLHNFMSPDECKFYIDLTDREFGYESIESEYPKDYRNSKRSLVLSSPLAHQLWDRLKTHLKQEDLKGIRPFGFDNNGKWKPFGMNECFRFSKYDQGEFFKPHIDGMFVRNANERSIFTIMIYLNDDFSGGETELYSDENGTQLLKSIRPKTGTAVLFNQDLPHAGAPIIQGTKYIIRSDIMFLRVDSKSIPPSNYESSETYKRAVELLEQSEEMERQGNVQEATRLYLEAQKLQANSPSITRNNDVQVSQFETLPEDSMHHIFEYLTAKQLTKMTALNRNLNEISREPRLWKNLYMSRWPTSNITALEEHLLASSAMSSLDDRAALHDWYHSFSMRALSEKEFRTIVFDFGSLRSVFGFHDDFAYLGKSVEKSADDEDEDSVSSVAKDTDIFDIPTVIGQPNHPHFYMRGRGMDDFICGDEHERAYHVSSLYPIQLGNVTNFKHLEILIQYMYDKKLMVSSESHPVLISTPPTFTPRTLELLAAIMFKTFRVPALCFVDNPLLAMYAKGLRSGLYIHSDRSTTHVVPVHDGQVLRHALKSSTINDTHISQFIGNTIKEFTQEKYFYDSHIEEAKSQMYVALDYAKEVEKAPLFSVQFYRASYVIPEVLISAPEIYFRPKDFVDVDSPGIVDLVIQSLDAACSNDSELRKSLLNNVVLGGTNFREIRGFKERLFQDFHQKTGDSLSLASNDKSDLVDDSYAFFYGGQTFANLSTFRDKCTTMDNYLNNNGSVLLRVDGQKKSKKEKDRKKEKLVKKNENNGAKKKCRTQ